MDIFRTQESEIYFQNSLNNVVLDLSQKKKENEQFSKNFDFDSIELNSRRENPMDLMNFYADVFLY